MNQKLVYKQLRNALHNRSIVTGRSGPGKISTPTHSHPSNVSSAASSTAMNTKSNISYSGNHSVATNPGAVGPKYNEFINVSERSSVTYSCGHSLTFPSFIL